jgi:hypothetical protein
MTSSRRYPLVLPVLVASMIPTIHVSSISIDTSLMAPWQWLACGLLITRICVACRPRPRGALFDAVSGAIEVISRGPLPQPCRRVYRRKLIELLSRDVLDEPKHTSLRRVAT